MPARKKHVIEDFQFSFAVQKQLFVIFMRSYSKKFAQFSENHLCRSRLFNKVAACNFIEKETLWHMLTKFLRIAFYLALTLISFTYYYVLFVLVMWTSFAAWEEREIFFQTIYKEIVWTQCLPLVVIVDF